MTLRTPRRRISPRTKRRYRAIKGFFKRTLGSASQPDIQITPSIALNVTDIKHKLGIDLQHPDAHTRGIESSVNNVSDRSSQAHTQIVRHDISQGNKQYGAPLNKVETKVLYKTSESHYKKSDDSEVERTKTKSNGIYNNHISNYYNELLPNNKRSEIDILRASNVDQNLRRDKTYSTHASFVSRLSASTFHSSNEYKEMSCLDPRETLFEEDQRNQVKRRSSRHQEEAYMEHQITLRSDTQNLYKEKEYQPRKYKQKPSEFNYDFIADIIQKQYKPVKFGRKVSDLSQFSAPECRDRESYFNNNENKHQAKYDPTYSYNKRHYSTRLNNSDHNDMRGVLERRLNDFNRNSRPNRKNNVDHNDSEMYDLVPVKEKSSPKSRRKFYKANMAPHILNREVPPSPRTHKPRLNLKAQIHASYEEVIDDMEYVRRPLPQRLLQQQEVENYIDYTTLPRRVLPKQPIDEYDDEIEYVRRPYRTLPKITKQPNSIDEEIPRKCLSNRQFPQHENESELHYVTRTYKKIPRRRQQQFDNETDTDNIRDHSSRCSIRRHVEQIQNDDGYMTGRSIARLSRGASPKRPIHDKDNQISFGRCNRVNTPKYLIENDNQPQIYQKRNNANLYSYQPQTNEMFTNSSSIETQNTEMPNTPLSKTQVPLYCLPSVNNTDKALSEIKDILQKFLQEIKKESQSEESEINNKTRTDCSPPDSSCSPNNIKSSNNNSTMPPNSFMATFGNTSCCYPVLTVCPFNCPQNGFPVPNPSLTCTHCACKSNEAKENISKNDLSKETKKTDTNVLIKEIYKLVSQSPQFARKADTSNEKLISPRHDFKLTSRSAGGSTQVYRQNAKVGTPKTNCVSKSCEAITKKLSEDYTSDINASYSETGLDKVSLQATATESITETDTTEPESEKVKLNKFAKAMKSWNIFKKKKKDVIEELSESEEEKEPMKPPYYQNITNYMMHSQDYYRPPPVNPSFNYPQNYRPHDYPHNYELPYNPELPDYSMSLPPHKNYHNSKQAAPTHKTCPCHHEHYLTAPPIANPYETYNRMPQAPLCLQEIEVKSIGCQSEKKLSFFRRLGKRNQSPHIMHYDNGPKTCSTQTAQNNNGKPGFLNWQAKATGRFEPKDFNNKTQNKLAAGDMKMRKAMIKKMFHKRNPFSPKNLIIKTLLGRDRSSFGEAPAVYRPRMFL